jgi:rifampicin phosphotransferase
MKKFYNFSVNEVPAIQDVGGKANSLIRLTIGGFKVPPGAVLSVWFFKDWIAELMSDKNLKDMWGKPEHFKALGNLLKSNAENLLYSEEQKSIIYAVLKEHKSSKLFAVRSSSPEEDLEGASFAGGYETLLGVNEENILDAVKKAFISCMDERVFFYKSQNGFDTSVLRIAVVIQEQIASDISGVGFSLNPLNNCYDEAVINANSGLGESVVSGMITPDEYVVNKNTKIIIERKIGSKEQAIILDINGGTRIIEGEKNKPVLKDDQVVLLTELITRIEEYYELPVDIEWAFCANELYLLQSRPITTFIPLPEEMQTAVDENTILYLDGSLTKQGITTPISVLGCDCLGKTQSVMFKDLMGKDVSQDIKGGYATTRAGRMYLNVSTMAKFQGLKRVAHMWKTVDVTTAEMLEKLDLKDYIPKKLPEAMKGAMWGAVKNNIGAIKYTRKAMKDPSAYKEWYQPYEEEFDIYLRGLLDTNILLSSAPEKILKSYIELLNKMLPMTYAAELARKTIRKQLEKLFKDGKERMQYLERSLPDNVTIDMGMKMYELSQMSEIFDNDYHSFDIKLKNAELSDKFIGDWKSYLYEFGCRTNNELDVAVNRSSDNIEDLFKQLKNMSGIIGELSPISIYKKSQNLREKTFKELIEKLSGKSRRKLEKKYDVLVKLGGKREALKYWYVRSLTAIREIIMVKANELVKKELLENVNDIFWLNFDIASNAEHYSKDQLNTIIAENRKYYRLLDQVHSFPKLIDSRGRILTLPAVEAKEGEVSGQPISPGIVTGKVKVLKTPDEKPLLPGEIMVTRATDPGWTPLFINASAIVLEVGGLLQHGALVAREYGKPCIAGIDNAMTIFEDGQLVEVDATKGLIKFLDNNNERSN